MQRFCGSESGSRCASTAARSCTHAAVCGFPGLLAQAVARLVEAEGSGDIKAGAPCVMLSHPVGAGTRWASAALADGGAQQTKGAGGTEVLRAEHTEKPVCPQAGPFDSPQGRNYNEEWRRLLHPPQLVLNKVSRWGAPGSPCSVGTSASLARSG